MLGICTSWMTYGLFEYITENPLELYLFCIWEQLKLMCIYLYLKTGQREYVCKIAFTLTPNSLQPSDILSDIPSPVTQNGFHIPQTTLTNICESSHTHLTNTGLLMTSALAGTKAVSWRHGDIQDSTTLFKVIFLLTLGNDNAPVGECPSAQLIR